MSFEPNDMNTIHLGNYEEFFILYMDNELSEEQVKMVDEFLLAHSDLKAEFEILMSTKLPLEKLSFDKKDLLADNMKQTLVDEELLLYIDDELPADKKKTVELGIASNKDYQLQHQLLLQTKLDSSEKIKYPNKKELYRRTEKRIPIKIWIRVAAAAVIAAIVGLLYFSNPNPSPIQPETAKNKTKPAPKQEIPSQQVPSVNNSGKQDLAVVNISTKKEGQQNTKKVETKQDKKEERPFIAVNQTQDVLENMIPRNRITDVQFDGDRTIALNEPKVSINKADVTSPSIERNINESSVVPKGTIASNDRKGSVKGFLRKATRMIEKRTGIDPTNENGELLIGMVAINLK